MSGAGALLWSSYLGGDGEDLGHGVAVDGSGNAFVVGSTASTDFPVSGGFDTALGSNDAFVTKVTGLALGASCTSPTQCLSSLCIDSVCCDRACAGKCEACTAARKGSGADGTCGFIDGRDPDNECPAQSCATSVITKPQVCNGAGACRSDGTLSCAPYACAGSVCGTTCSTDAMCAPSAYCLGTSCVASLDPGAACSRGAMCKSGFCADSVCCDKACAGDCEACTATKKGSGTDGTCGNVLADTDPRDKCPADPTPLSCAADGMCDGAGACRRYAKMGTACGATACATGSVSGKTCNGAGTCETATIPCAPYACGTGACRTSCTSDSDCAADGYCTTAKTCATKQKSGGACTEGRECEKGFCVDGACCESACTGQCEACNESGTAGKCTPVSGAPRGKRVPCAGDPTICSGSCDGTNASACKLAPSTKSCGSTCAAGKETPSSCDGLGACATGRVSDCSPFICADDKRCATTCTTDCAVGFKCAAGTCVPGAGTCSADGTTSTSTEGKLTSCGAYRCDPSTGTCRQFCASSSECANGTVCDVNAKVCAPAAAPASDESGGCGCETGPRPGAWSLLGALPFAILIGLRRRRAH